MTPPDMEADKKLIPLTDLAEGESGVVWEFMGGHNLVRRLEALGVRRGKQLKKVSGMFMRGPITVQVGHTQVSVGYGMASKIMVEAKR
jgi:Fe2+ transport system protein FeoA